MPTLSELKRRRPKSREAPWWDKPPTLPGEGCTTAQRRLAEHFTETSGLLKAYGGPSRIGVKSGDFCTSPPILATKLLMNRSHGELTTPKRAADFRTETEWRLQLRPLSPAFPSTQPLRLPQLRPLPARR